MNPPALAAPPASLCDEPYAVSRVGRRVMHAPRLVSISITARCNLRCSYCYAFDNPAMNGSDLPTEAWLQFFDELGRLGVMRVRLGGGEALVRDDFRALVEGIARNRMRFAVLTNGRLLNDETTAFLAGTGRCDYVQVSVDGSCPETHDIYRGRGSFTDAMRAIRTLRHQDVPITIYLTVHRRNLHDLEATARLLLEEMGLRGLSVAAAFDLGAGHVHRDAVVLTPGERQMARETLWNLSQRYPGRIGAISGPLAEARLWRRMKKAHQEGASGLPGGGHLMPFRVSRFSLRVLSDGAIVPYCMLADMVLGYANQDPLAEVWRCHPLLTHLRQRHTIPLTDFDFCDGCSYVPYCTGGDPVSAYVLTGRVNHPDPAACLRQFVEGGGTID